jgi:hypothetical protein
VAKKKKKQPMARWEKRAIMLILGSAFMVDVLIMTLSQATRDGFTFVVMLIGAIIAGAFFLKIAGEETRD